MDLAKFEESIGPSIEVVLRNGIPLEAAAESFMVKAVKVAMAESGDNQSTAAKKLGVSQGFVSGVYRGVRLTRFRGKKKPANETPDSK